MDTLRMLNLQKVTLLCRGHRPQTTLAPMKSGRSTLLKQKSPSS